MSRIGYTWNDEYREQFYKSEKVQEHLKHFIAQAKQPKTPEQREKMSLAASGKAKSAAHRERLAEVQKFRQSLKKQILESHPDLTSDEVWTLVRIEMEQE